MLLFQLFALAVCGLGSLLLNEVATGQGIMSDAFGAHATVMFVRGNFHHKGMGQNGAPCQRVSQPAPS